MDGDDWRDTPVTAFWVQGASDEQRDAHYKAQRWAHVLPLQVDRLYETCQRAMQSNEKVMREGLYPDEGRWPFLEIDAEAHFVLVAARQLVRALRAFDGDDRLPEGLTNAQVRDVRDALEHWDKPGGSEAARRLEKLGADASALAWTLDGPGVMA